MTPRASQRWPRVQGYIRLRRARLNSGTVEAKLLIRSFFNTYRAKKAGIKRKVKKAMTDALD